MCWCVLWGCTRDGRRLNFYGARAKLRTTPYALTCLTNPIVSLPRSNSMRARLAGCRADPCNTAQQCDSWISGCDLCSPQLSTRPTPMPLAVCKRLIVFLVDVAFLAGRLVRPHPFTCTEVADIDRPHHGSVQLIPDYAQANTEHMREQEVRPDLAPYELFAAIAATARTLAHPPTKLASIHGT